MIEINSKKAAFAQTGAKGQVFVTRNGFTNSASCILQTLLSPATPHTLENHRVMDSSVLFWTDLGR